LRGSIKRLVIAAGLATAVAAPGWAAQLPDGAISPNAGMGSVLAGQDSTGATDREAVAQHQWRTFMAQSGTPGEGCFHASYPDTLWEKVDCSTAQPPVHPTHVRPSDGDAEVVGNGNDYVAYAKGLITLADGTFSISGVKSESSVGVAAFGGGGILGSNEYSVQLNTNDRLTTSACAGHSGCTVWQQFVYATDYAGAGKAGVFMQYWLIGWGSSSCPGSFGKYGTDCFKNSAIAVAPDVPIKDLGNLELEGTASAGGNDSVVFSYGSDTYTITAKDSVLDISSVWDKTEFNVVGDAGGSRADFNSGSSVTATILLFDSSSLSPTCLANAGTTGETNNLNLGACNVVIGIFGIPFVQFSESN
jgi:hypothetical protein